jgi:hypothetical protein
VGVSQEDTKLLLIANLIVCTFLLFRSEATADGGSHHRVVAMIASASQAALTYPRVDGTKTEDEGGADDGRSDVEQDKTTNHSMDDEHDDASLDEQESVRSDSFRDDEVSTVDLAEEIETRVKTSLLITMLTFIGVIFCIKAISALFERFTRSNSEGDIITAHVAEEAADGADLALIQQSSHNLVTHQTAT